MYTTEVMEPLITATRTVIESTALACAAGVGVCAVGAGTYWITKKLARSTRQIAAVSLVGAVLIGGMVVVGTDDAGTKQMENGELIMDNAGGAASTLHSPFSILHLDGWRVFSVVSNNVTATDVFAFSNANAACASVWEAAQRHGAVYGHWALPLEGWLFPFGDSGWTHPFLRCEGVLRDSFCEDVNQIRFLAPFALCPAANWPRYGLDASRAWLATNDVGGLTVAVENGALGNDPAQIACARIDLDPSLGEIRLRYDLSRIGETTFDVGPTLNGTNTFVTVGISFSVEGVSNIVDRGEFWNLPLALDSLGNVVVQETVQQLVDTYDRHDCIELYFAGRFSLPNVLAVHLPGGIVIPKTDVKMLAAHELGHALGLMDAYYELDGRGKLACSGDPVRRSTFLDITDEDPDIPYVILDWGRETGRGFYAADDTVERTIGKLLMHGNYKSGQIDIPGAFILSLDCNSTTNSNTYVPVGFDAIGKSNEETYSR